MERFPSVYYSELMPWAELDRTDRALVAELQNDARLTNKELAERVGVAPSTCLERVRALRARGVVRGYAAEVNPAALGRPIQALVSVRILRHSRELVDGFRRHALALPATIGVFNVSGANDFLVHVAVASTDALRELILDEIASRPEVSHTETLLIFDHVRKPLEPAEP
jgi:DNA-binding Lrp family transcriptional regulator